MQEGKALLVIDMQKGSFTEATPRYDAVGIITRINSLAQQFRAKNHPVIFIQHDGTREGAFLPDTEEWKILDELEVTEKDNIISKTANDAFYESELASFLIKKNINELFITGCATDFCVESTIQSALTKNYNITVIEDGHTTGDRPHMDAEKVIDHYNWIWKNMIPTGGSIELKKHELIEL